MKRTLCVVLASLLVAARAPAQEWIDRLDEALTLSAADDQVRARLSGRADAEAYRFTGPTPGVLDTAGDDLRTARLSLYVDAQLGPRLYGFAQARVDQGFDPADGEVEARLDEYALRFTPWDDGRLNLQAGQFASVVGRWIARHDAWENPFVNAPLAYEQVTPIRDTAAPESAAEFGTIEEGERYEYNPVVWGPAYATGASAAGRLGAFTCALEIKNAGLSSRPESWPAGEGSFAHPHVGGRIGWQPDARWDLGFSAAEGPYFREEAAATLPAGRDVYDFTARTLAQDVSFAWHHLQLWAEVFEAAYEVPLVGDARVVSGFVEAKYKFAPRWFAALRWNQQLYGNVEEGNGGGRPWGDDTWRADAAVGFRPTAHTQLKLQHSVQHETGTDRDRDDLTAVQASLRF